MSGQCSFQCIFWFFILAAIQSFSTILRKLLVEIQKFNLSGVAWQAKRALVVIGVKYKQILVSLKYLMVALI